MGQRLIEHMYKGKPLLARFLSLVHDWEMKNRILLSFCLAALVLPAACTQFPALDSRATPELLAADYPALVPIDPLLAKAEGGQVNIPQIENGLTSRVERLQARAAQLRGSVLSGPEKQRLSQGLQ
jgi:hypothetical protein|tara:strand:- start:1829 stop:2206 length:378 start_codon:yes stop_codon:yes gene_type:complete